MRKRALALVVMFAFGIGACSPQEVAFWEWVSRSPELADQARPMDTGRALQLAKSAQNVPSLPGTGLAWSSPLPGRELMSPFGPRGGRQHKGTDVWCTEGADPVRAVRNGIVAHTGTGTGFGLLVVVDHGDGSASLYAHLDSIEVHVGQPLRQGDELAVCGRSGIRVSPAHLHVEVRGDQFTVGARNLDAYHSFLQSTPRNPQGLFNL